MCVCVFFFFVFFSFWKDAEELAVSVLNNEYDMLHDFFFLYLFSLFHSCDCIVFLTLYKRKCCISTCEHKAVSSLEQS